MKHAALLLACTMAAGLAAEPEITTLSPGAAAPDFQLRGVDDREWALKDFAAAQALVIVFTCNHCPTAQAYEDRLKQIVVDYKEKGVEVVAISPNDPKSVRLDELGYSDLGDSLADMKIRAKEKAFNFPYLYDGDSGEVSRAYGPAATPHAFVFDAERKLCYVGRIDDSEREAQVKRRDLREALDAILAGRAPEVAQTKTFGCSVKWSGKEEELKAYEKKLAEEPVSLELIDVAGMKQLRQGEGAKLRLVNFWATWCGPCVTEFPDIVELHHMYRNREFEIVTVSANEPDERAEVLKFLQKKHASMRNVLFSSSDKYAMLEAFDPEMKGNIPYTALLSAKGEILYKVEGPIEPLRVKQEILKALGREMQK
jgi:peroxiredoxin